ncbi:hypothetical protein JW935_07095 [candidate division KSB1 bacterium]|nr:hypothetical protein [candidate division KSB1 bacterium]
MKVFFIFIQIVLFPVAFLILSWLFTLWAKRKKNKFVKFGYATQFAISVYIVGGAILFPLYFVFKPTKIDGITYLLGLNLWAYWLITYILVLPFVGAITAYFIYFKRVSISKYYKDGLLLGIYQIPWAFLFEIFIYVYWRKTIPSIYDYFFGKNYPWIEIAWIISILSPLIAAHISKRVKDGR